MPKVNSNRDTVQQKPKVDKRRTAPARERQLRRNAVAHLAAAYRGNR